MITQEELAAIRAQEKAASPGSWLDGKYSVNDSKGFPICCQFTNDNDKRFMARARRNIPLLLDALDEALAERDEITKEFNKLADGLYTVHKAKEYLVDRDIWKAYAKALMRAIPHECPTCAHMQNGVRDVHCTACRYGLNLIKPKSRNELPVLWLFDQARFAANAENDRDNANYIDGGNENE